MGRRTRDQLDAFLTGNFRDRVIGAITPALFRALITDILDSPIYWTVSSTAPAAPLDGDGWYDTSTDTLNIWNGSAWVEVSAEDLNFNNTMAGDGSAVNPYRVAAPNPAYPAAGERHNKRARFSDDALIWEVDIATGVLIYARSADTPSGGSITNGVLVPPTGWHLDPGDVPAGEVSIHASRVTLNDQTISYGAPVRWEGPRGSGAGGEIDGVEAGDGLQGGGNSGTVTLSVRVGNGVRIQNDAVTLLLDGSTLSLSATGLKLADSFPRYRGPWVSGTDYNVGDWVRRTDGVHLCNTANSDTTFTPANWDNISGEQSYITYIYYRESASRPARPTVAKNASGQITGITAGWSQTDPDSPTNSVWQVAVNVPQTGGAGNIDSSLISIPGRVWRPTTAPAPASHDLYLFGLPAKADGSQPDTPTEIPSGAAMSDTDSIVVPTYNQGDYWILAQPVTVPDITHITVDGIDQTGAYDKSGTTFRHSGTEYEYWITEFRQRTVYIGDTLRIRRD